MKLKEINNYNDLKKYCNCSMNYVETIPQTPNATIIFPIEYYGQTNSGSIKYYELPATLDDRYFTTKGIKAIIFSYDTPIGIVRNNIIYILNNAYIRLSHTTDNILREFNKKFLILSIKTLFLICELLDIDMGYFNDMYTEDFRLE